MRDLKKLELVTENLEVIEIPVNTIGHLEISGIEQCIGRMACNYIGRYETAKRFAIEIFKEADTDYNPFGRDETRKVFDRLLQFMDITQICVTFTDGEEHTFLVPYDEGDQEGQLGAENENQSVYLSTQGNLYIVIDPEKRVFDLFDQERIDDPKETEFKRRIMSIGKDHDIGEEDL